jgi:Uma2 family endonuclease
MPLSQATMKTSGKRPYENEVYTMPTPPHEPPLTVEEYFTLDEATLEGKYEYYDGNVRCMAGGTPQHAMVSMNIGIALGAALRNSSCRIFSSDGRVQLSATIYVYPDITVSCSTDDFHDPKTIKFPFVVFEVLTPSTEKIDRNQKANLYRACTSIEAYVLIEPLQLSVEVYQRAGPFWQHSLYNTSDALVDIVPLGVKIPILEIYRGIELPPTPQLPEAEP